MNDHFSRYPIHMQAILVVIITIGLTFFAGALAIVFGFQRHELMLVEFFTIIPSILFVLYRKLSFVHTFRLRPVNVRTIVTTIFIGVSLSILADEADRLMAMIFPMPESLMNAIQDSLKIRTTRDMIIIVFSAVFLAGICEELVFRGFLQTSFEQNFDVTKSVMLTSLVFAMVHMNPWWTIQLILFSIFLGVLAWKSNSIIPSMLVHSLNNGLALSFTNLEESQLQWYLWNDHVNPAIVGVAGILLYFGFKQFYRCCDEYKTNTSNQNWGRPVS